MVVKEIKLKPTYSLISRGYVQFILWFLGRAIEGAWLVDREVKNEFENLGEGLILRLSVLPKGPGLTVYGNGKKRPVVSLRPPRESPTLKIQLRQMDGALRLFTFREGTTVAEANSRMIADGPIPNTCGFVRILNRVESLILPKFIAKLAVKRYIRPKFKITKLIFVYLKVFSML